MFSLKYSFRGAFRFADYEPEMGGGGGGVQMHIHNLVVLLIFLFYYYLSLIGIY